MMTRVNQTFSVVLLLLIGSSAAWAKPSYKVFGYLPNYATAGPTGVNINANLNTPAAFPWQRMTHVMEAFAIPNAAGNGIEWNATVGMQRPGLPAAAHSNNTRVMLSIGGADPSGSLGLATRWRTATSAANCPAFVADIMNKVQTYGYDGVDIDWEFPNANNAFPGETAQFMDLMQRLYNAMHNTGDVNWKGNAFDGQQRHLTFFISPGYDICGVNWAQIGARVDYGILGGYDFNTPYNGPTSDPSPMTRCNGVSAARCITSTVQYLTVNNPFPLNKLVLAMPMYSQIPTPNGTALLTILRNGVRGTFRTPQDEEAWTYGGNTHYLDVAQSYCRKMTWAFGQKNMPGIALWSIELGFPQNDGNAELTNIWRTIEGDPAGGCPNLPAPCLTCTSSCPTIPAGLVDFADGDNVNLWGGNWANGYIPAGSTGTLAVNVTGYPASIYSNPPYANPCASGPNAVRFNGNAANPATGVPSMQTALAPGAATKDISAYNTLTFWMRATTGQYRFVIDRTATRVTGGNDHYGANIVVAAADNNVWKQYTFYFSDLTQAGWGGVTPKAWNDSIAIAWMPLLAGAYDFTLDDVEFKFTPATPTPSRSPTPSITRTNSPTPVNSPTSTFTMTPSSTHTPTVTPSRTNSPANTPTYSFTLSSTPSRTSTASFTPSITLTRSPTPSHSPSPTSSRTSTPSSTSSPTSSSTSSPTPTLTRTPTPTITLTHTTAPVGSSATPTPTVTNSHTNSPTVTPSRTSTPSHTRTITVTFSSTITLTRTISQTFTHSPNATNTVSPTITNTFSSSATPSVSPSRTASPSSTLTLTLTPVPPTFTRSSTPSFSVTSTDTVTLTPVPPSATISPTATVTRTPAPGDLLDNAEDGNPTNLWGGFWTSYAPAPSVIDAPDATTAGHSPSPHGTLYSIGVTGTNDPLAPSQASVSTTLNATGVPQDMSMYDRIGFWFYGSSSTNTFDLFFHRGATANWDDFHKSFTVTPNTWTYIELNLADFVRDGWSGSTVPMDWSDVISLYWLTFDDSAFVIRLDDIELKKPAGSPTVTPTFSRSPTVVPTATSSHSPVNTASPTRTPTLLLTPTRSITPPPPGSTFTFTSTISPTPTQSPTVTLSQTASVPTVTTPADLSGPIEIEHAVPGPNPNPSHFHVKFKGGVDSVTIRIYSRAMACVAVVTGPGSRSQHWQAVPVPSDLYGKLGSGTYYYTASGERGGVKCLKPWVGKFAIFR